MSILTRKTLLLAKLEATKGTDPVPTADNDAILVAEPTISYDITTIERDVVRGTISPAPPRVGAKTANITFRTELKGSGTAGTAPEVDPLFQASGFEPTVVTASSVTYNPVSDDIKTCTIYAYFTDADTTATNESLLHKITGARGSFRIIMEAGNYGQIEWTFQGKYVAPTDVDTGSLPSASYDTTVPPVIESIGLSIGTWGGGAYSRWEVDSDNTLVHLPDVNSADGRKLIVSLTARNTKGSFDPEAVLIADHDFFSELTGGSGVNLNGVVGTVAGNITTIDAPLAVYAGLDYGEREGVRSFEIPFTCIETTANDELSIAFT